MYSDDVSSSGLRMADRRLVKKGLESEVAMDSRKTSITKSYRRRVCLYIEATCGNDYYYSVDSVSKESDERIQSSCTEIIL